MSDGKDKIVQNNENENQNFDEVSELDNNEEVNDPNQSFIEYENKDIPKAYLWWDNLQKTLDKEGCEIDLTQPEDTARLNIVEFVKLGRETYEFTDTFALDPEKRKIDVINIKDDEILERQKTKDVSDDVILRMYNAAKSGNLFVTYHIESKVQSKQRQILVDENGLPKIGNDIEHTNKYENEAIAYLEEPNRKPEKPDDDLYNLAEEGDKEAKKKIESYERSLRIYNTNMKVWNRVQEIKENDPDFYNKTYNLAVVTQQYFEDMWTPKVGEARIDYHKRLTQMHKNSVLMKMPEDLRNAHIYLDEVTKKLKENEGKIKASLNGKLKGELGLASRKILSESFIYRDEMLRVQNAIKEGNVQNLERMSDEVFNQKLNDLRESNQYKNGFYTVDIEEIDSMLMSENTKKFAKLDKLIKKTNDNSEFNPRKKENSTRDEVLGLLQEALNEGGFDINLNSKEDLARLYISEIDKNNICTMRYATDPEQKPIDPETITKEETLNRLGNNFDEETIDRIIKAAKEGRLFAEGHMNQRPPVGAKQIVLNGDKTFKLSKRPEELTGDEAEVFEMLEKPREVTDPVPGGFDKFLAFFGNKNAQTKINRYESAVRSYNTKMEKWNRVQQMDKTVRDRARNYSFTVSGFFNATHENGFDYKESLTELHRDAEIAKLDPIENKKELEMETYYEDLREEIVKTSKNFISLADNNFVDSEDKINDTNAFMLATTLIARNEMLKIDKIRENKDFQNFEPKSSEQIIQEATILYNSPAFKEYADSTTNATLITTYESIKTEKYTYIAVLDEMLTEVMPEDPIEDAVKNVDDGRKKDKKMFESVIKAKNEEKIRAKLGEYKKTLGKCMLHLKNCEHKDPIANINSEKADPDIAKTLAMMFTISKEMKNIGNRKESEWKSLKDLENDSKKFYESNSFKEMSKFITVDEAMKVVNNEKGSPADIINGVEKLFDDADKKVKLESTIDKSEKKEDVKEIKNNVVNQFNL